MPPWFSQHQQLALDRADAGGADIAIAQADVAGILADEDQHGLQVFQVKERQPLLIRHAEGDVEHALLCIGQVEEAGQQQRAHLGHGGADGVALLGPEIPEGDGEGRVAEVIANRGGAGGEGAVQLALGGARLGEAGEVALHVGQEDGDAGGGEGLGQDLQGDGLAGAGGARDQAVAVAVFEQQVLGDGMAGAAAADEDRAGGEDGIQRRVRLEGCGIFGGGAVLRHGDGLSWVIVRGHNTSLTPCCHSGSCSPRVSSRAGCFLPVRLAAPRMGAAFFMQPQDERHGLQEARGKSSRRLAQNRDSVLVDGIPGRA